MPEQTPATPSKPRINVPPGACDAHIHIIDYASKYPRVPGEKDARYEGNFERYKAVQKVIGTERVVVVHTAMYPDNRLLLDLIKADKGVRGIAIVGPRTSAAHWKELEQARGVRGIRITTRDPRSPELDMIEPLGRRLADLGWHLQVHFGEQMLIDLAPRLEQLPCTLVVDHFGRLEPSQGTNGAGFKALARLLASGRVYCKLAAPNRVSHQEPPYSDLDWLARALVDLAPERIVWGTDWPNVNFGGTMPDAGMLIDCLAVWAPDEKIRHKILVENPARLYDY